MKKFFYTLAATLAVIGSSAIAEEWDVQDMNTQINNTNFIVEDFCSATFISDEHDLLLTNHHCVDNNVSFETREVVLDTGEVVKRKFEVRDPMSVSQKRYEGHELVSYSSWMSEIVAYKEGSDLAILRILDSNMAPIEAAPLFTGDKVLRGEVAYAVGNPMMLDATVTKGIISSTNRSLKVGWGNDKTNFYQMDAGIAGGSSGGSLYNSKGELIGVPAASARGTMVGLAIPYTEIQKFLEENCYAEVFDPEAVSYKECVENKEDDNEDE